MNLPEIQFSLNGAPETLPRSMTLSELIAHYHWNDRTIAIGRNREVVSKRSYSETKIEPGDRIDVVHFVAGG